MCRKHSPPSSPVRPRSGEPGRPNAFIRHGFSLAPPPVPPRARWAGPESGAKAGPGSAPVSGGDGGDEADGTPRDDLAKDRTDLAEDRTLLAHERSFAGWVRTGMAAVGIGLGFNALFQTLEPDWVPKAIATIFLVIAGFIFISAERRACHAIARLEAHNVAALAPVRLRLMTWVLTAATIALGVAIWALA